MCNTAAIYIDWKFHNYITKSNRPSQTKTGVINLKRRKTSGGNLHSCLVCVFFNFLLKTEYVILGFPNNCKLLVPDFGSLPHYIGIKIVYTCTCIVLWRIVCLHSSLISTDIPYLKAKAKFEYVYAPFPFLAFFPSKLNVLHPSQHPQNFLVKCHLSRDLHFRAINQ